MKRNAKVEWLGLGLLFLVCVLTYGLLGTYARQITVYHDELRYLHLARSLFAGNGLQIRGTNTDYQKILYPLCLLPAIALKNTTAQITAIGWINAIWMASSIFPVYALAARTGQSKKRTWFFIVLTAVYPSMAATATFMSETIFLPLSLWMVYLAFCCIDAEKMSVRMILSGLMGGMGYILYLNKEVALYFILAYFLTRWWWLYFHREQWRAELYSHALIAGIFVLCFVTGKLTLFSGTANSYQGLIGRLTAEQWRYFPRALIVDFVFSILAFGVFTVFVPLAGLRAPKGKTEENRNTQFAAFLLLCIAIGVVAVVYTITVREDLNSMTPRQHVRYIEPLLLPLLMLTMNELSKNEAKGKNSLLIPVGTGVVGIGLLLACSSIGAGACDNTFLQWYDFVVGYLDRLPVLNTTLWLLVWRVCIVAWLALLCVLLRHRRMYPMMAAGVLLWAVICNAGEQRVNRWSYTIPVNQMQTAGELNETLKTLQGNIVVVVNDIRGKDSRLVDTYIDAGVYLCEYRTMLSSGVLADNVFDMTTEKTCPEGAIELYEALDSAEWVLAAEGVPLDTSDLAVSEIQTPQGFTLYKNNAPQELTFVG